MILRYGDKTPRIPPGSLVVGVPGKVVRHPSEEERVGLHRHALKYAELAGVYRDAGPAR